MSVLAFPEGRELDYIGLGRLCIDLNANEIHRPMEETVTFTKYLGGSPANITIAAAKLGAKTGFIGRVSDDQHGRFIQNYMRRHGVNMEGVVVDRAGSKTGLAFTEIKSPTDCSILMYRDNAADLNLEPGDVKEEYIKKAKILLVSGTALARSPSREAVFVALEYARRNGVVTFMDIDFRPYTWASAEEVAVYCKLAAEKCDVILGGRDEFNLMEYVTGPTDNDDAKTAEYWFGCHAKLVVVKRGEEGSYAFTADGQVHRGRTFPANVVKTFGAGDSFAGAFIYGLLNGFPVQKCQEWGSAAASIVVSSHSCSDAMPTAPQIEELIAAHS